MARHTIDETYDAVVELHKEFKALNGTVRQNCIDIAVLKERQAGDTGNWAKVWDILKPVLIALITAGMMLAAKAA